MPGQTLAARRFTEADQAHFAKLSGDTNPMHMDRVAARRTQAGAPVVHGLHAALWALDTVVGAYSELSVATLKIRFQKFIYVGADTTLRLVRRTEQKLVVELVADGVTAATVSVGLGPASEEIPASLSSVTVSVDGPAVLDVDDLAGRHGLLPVLADAPFAGTFPRLSGALGATRVVAMAQLSTLVGMICPGLHSIFAALDVELVSANPPEPLGFRVEDTDERFRMTTISIAGGGLRGSVTAFVRHPPIQQPKITDLAGLIAPDEFKATTALVIGGSRGLGALTARMIAAGGGRVIVSFATGEAEAEALAKEIRSHAGPSACQVLRYDAREAAVPQLDGLEWSVNQLYYFATSRIFLQKTTVYEPCVFAEFARFYIDGFHDLCMALHAGGGPSLSVFYPSSVAVSQHPEEMCEYSMAKAAGEILCTDMNRSLDRARIVVSRLPRILTDQTATVAPVESSDPIETMLPIVREMHSPAG